MTADVAAATGGHQNDDVVPLLPDYLDDDAAVRTAERIEPIGGVAVTLGPLPGG
jgi:hypothetical protein